MLRDAQDAPSSLFQLPIHLAVTFAVAGDLALPKLPVALGCTVALRTSVPEASVHEDRQLFPPESEVRPTGQWKMSSPSRDPFLFEELRYHSLRPLVPLPLDQGHHLGSFLLGEDVRHYSYSASPPMAS